jgi:hypothetical protein
MQEYTLNEENSGDGQMCMIFMPFTSFAKKGQMDFMEIDLGPQPNFSETV